MKLYMTLGFEVKTSSSLRKVERLTFNLPCWADDTDIISEIKEGNTIFKIRYWRGRDDFYIDLPKCNKACKVSLTPLYRDDYRDDPQILRPVYNTNRKIIVDIYK